MITGPGATAAAGHAWHFVLLLLVGSLHFFIIEKRERERKISETGMKMGITVELCLAQSSAFANQVVKEALLTHHRRRHESSSAKHMWAKKERKKETSTIGWLARDNHQLNVSPSFSFSPTKYLCEASLGFFWKFLKSPKYLSMTQFTHFLKDARKYVAFLW